MIQNSSLGPDSSFHKLLQDTTSRISHVSGRHCNSDSSEPHWGGVGATRRKPAIDRYSKDPEISLSFLEKIFFAGVHFFLDFHFKICMLYIYGHTEEGRAEEI